MKKALPVITIVLLFVIGFGVLLYPTIGNILNKMTSSAAISSYRTQVNAMDDEEIEEKLSFARQYNKMLSSADGVNFMSGNDFTSLSEYADNFSIDEVLGFISIPKINIYLPIYAGDEEAALEKGIWLMDNTSIPIEGESVNSGLSGHRGLPSAKFFTDLDQLEIGDQFFIYVLGEALAYEVDDISVVLPEEAQYLDIIKGEDHVTLVTCTPYGINTHRLLIRGTRTEFTNQDVSHSGLLEDNVRLVPWVILGIAIIAALVPIIIISSSRRRRLKLEKQKLRRKLLGAENDSDENSNK